MRISELVIGIGLIVMAYVMMRLARPREGVLPAFLQIRGMRPVYTWGVLLGLFVGGTFIGHAVLAY